MSHSESHFSAATAQATSAIRDTTLRDLFLSPESYPTSSISSSLASPRHSQVHYVSHSLSPFPSTSATTTTSTTVSTSAIYNTSSPPSSSHTFSGAAAAHLIKQHQQLRQQQQQAIHDNARTLPARVRGTTATIPTAATALNLNNNNNVPLSTRKNGGNRVGTSILGQLLSVHSPGGRSNKLASDSPLSSEVHQPREQQRRSFFPSGWGLNWSLSSSSKSRTMHGPSVTSMPSAGMAASTTATVTEKLGRAAVGSNPLENNEPIDRLQPVLPSVWLESILSGLSRTDLNTPPHYATLPRITVQEDRQQPAIFPGLGPRSKNENTKDKSLTSSGKHSRLSPSTTATPPSPIPASAQQPKSKTLDRKGSVCELALGDDARELFLQNRPKTLSSAVISSEIVPLKESLRNNIRQRSLDSSAVAIVHHKPASEPSLRSRTPTSATTLQTGSSPAQATPTTVKTTRGRFTIESQSTLPSPSRTRTLSCTSASALIPVDSTAHLATFSPSTQSSGNVSHQFQEQKMPTSPRKIDRPSSNPLTHSPTLSHSLPSSRSSYSVSSSTSPFQPSPQLSPSTDHVSTNNNNSNSASSISMHRASFSSSSPTAASHAIPPNGRSLHQRSQSTTSSLSRFSQVIIPPPASAASLQFASFSSMGSPSQSSAPSNTSDSSWSNSRIQESSTAEKRSNNTGGSNNIRNLSIQIAEVDRSTSRNTGNSTGGGQSSRRQLDYGNESTPVHPLDEDHTHLSPSTASLRDDGSIRTHQTMNRVHPNQDQDFVDSPGGSEGSSTRGSRGGSISGGGPSFMALPSPDRRASENSQQQKQYEGTRFGYYSRTSSGSFRPRSLSTTNLDSSSHENGPSLHQQLSRADRATSMQREGSSHSHHSRFEVGPSSASTLSPLSPYAHGITRNNSTPGPGPGE
ncbi:hypothetical protein FBU30_008940, partial [Linnemannia zychae]